MPCPVGGPQHLLQPQLRLRDHLVPAGARHAARGGHRDPSRMAIVTQQFYRFGEALFGYKTNFLQAFF